MNILPFVLLLSALQADMVKPLSSPDEHLLLNLQAHGLEPIAVRQSDGSFRELPLENETALKNIVSQFFAPGTLYPAWFHGQAQGEFRVQAYHPPGCSGFGLISGTFSGPAAKSERPYLGFSSRYPGTRDLKSVRPLTPSLQQTALELSQQRYQQEGLTPAQLKRFKLERVTPLEIDGVANLLISSRIERGPETIHSCHTHQLTLLAEQTPGGWVNRLELLKSESQQEGECSRYEPLGVFDNGTGTPHLAVEGHGYEWNWYEIYRQTADHSWQQIFNGGGGGC